MPESDLHEPDIKIGTVQLNAAQAIVVRVAVRDFLSRLAPDAEFRKDLGDIGPLYEWRLREVESMLVDSSNAKKKEVHS